jgi:hypothetical protein
VIRREPEIDTDGGHLEIPRAINSASVISSPSMTIKCVHCLRELTKKTKDHVFPASWYPDTTPNDVQRWTVPSCSECNGTLGKIEKEMFVRLALCTNPTRAEASGMSKSALRSLGIGVDNLTPKEKAHRIALAKKVFLKVKPLKDRGGIGLLPGLGPHEGFPAGEQLTLTISNATLYSVSEKIIRGCEYKLNNEGYIEKPYRLKIYFVYDKGIEDVTALLDSLPATHLGPGFEVRRGQSPLEEGVQIVLYRVVIWGTLKIYATIDNEGMFEKKRS